MPALEGIGLYLFIAEGSFASAYTANVPEAGVIFDDLAHARDS